MSEERRIVLWRRAIFQFRRFSDKEGAFHKAGLTDFRIEQNIVGLADSKPDIIGWRKGSGGHGEDYPLAMELTLNDERSKLGQIERYRALKPEQLAPIGISSSGGPEVVLGTLSGYPFDEELCVMILSDTMTCTGTQHIGDVRLREALEGSDGMDLVHIPEIHFTIVPESKFMELRRGMAGRLIAKFGPNAEGFTAEDLTLECLDFIARHIAEKSLEQLIRDVERQLDQLVDKQLRDYLRKDGGRYVLTERGEKVHTSAQSKDKVIRQISAWMNERKLEDFDESPVGGSAS